ncbi:MAG: efflux RND transporter periplasmic adaptor subunit [Phycisphaeraceae bacterium]|nr:efflux RND transporter periplasmic adaptor subunit [Phycisphaeraceae bacterium]
MNQPDKSSSRKWIWPIVAVAVVLLVGAGWWLTTGGGEPEQEMPLAAVERGPLTIHVNESGTIQAREQLVIKSEVEGQATIIYLVEEGERVEEGDLLVELDASGLNDRKVDQEISVQNAQAAYVKAREGLEVTRSKAESDVASAELKYDFAKLDLRKYAAGMDIDLPPAPDISAEVPVEESAESDGPATETETSAGEFLQQLRDAEASITLAREEWERAKAQVEGSQRLYRQKYISLNELESDRLAAKRAELDYRAAVDDRELLITYTHPRKLAELRSEVRQTEMALDRAQRKASADVIQAEADLKARESELKRQKDKLQKIIDQLTKTRIVAPREGMVVYATTVHRRRRQDPLAEGQEVRERQELIYLPTASRMTAEVDVHESVLNKVKVGQPVKVTVDAMPRQAFPGRVEHINIMAESGGWWNPDLKEYATRVVLDEPVPGLRPGMNCKAEILVAHYPDALKVPMQSVVRIAGVPVVYVKENETITPRPIEIGLDDNAVVRVTGGLEAGEQVLLAPPLEPTREAIEQVRMAAGIEATTGPDPEAVAAADAAAKAETEKSDDGLDEETRAALGMAKRMNERGALKFLGLKEDQLKQLKTALAALESGEPPALDDGLKKKLTTMHKQFKARMQQRQQQGADRG